MRGIDKFKERFTGHDGEYVLIGGGACDLLFGEAGQDFRATKDLDLVLLVEALTPEFGQIFWDFVKEGGYENRQKSSGKPQFYRFSKPEDPAFPAMLELFARTDVDLRDAESGLMPIHIDDEVSSLSAILLDEEYYQPLDRQNVGQRRRRPVGRGADPLQGQGVARPFRQAGGWPGRRREEREEAPKRRLPPRHAARGRRAPRHERGGPRRHAALPGCLRVGPRRPQGAQDQGRRGAAGRRGAQERLPAVAQLSDSATVRRHLGQAARAPRVFRRRLLAPHRSYWVSTK